MAEIDIFPEQTVEGFAANNDFAGLHTALQPTDVNLVLGETYWVVWDGTEYEAVAQDAGILEDGAVLLGNGALLQLSSNNEPFAIGTVSGTILFVSMTETTESHVIRIYQKTESAEEETPEGIVLRNYDGIDEIYSSVEKLRVRTSTGDKQIYSKGIAVEGVEIEPDFSAGDQTVNAADGYLVKSAVIKKPETLVPENIPEGTVIAGVVGTKKISEAEEKTVDLDFSEGDMVLTPDEGKLWSQVTIPTPANLVPENIAAGVEIAGVLGSLAAGEGVSDVVLLAWCNSRTTSYTSTAGTTTIYSRIYLPPNSNILARVGGSGISGSNSSTGQYGVPNQTLSLNPTVSTSTVGNLILYQITRTTGTYKYRAALATLIMMFTIPGLRVITDEATGEVLLYAAASVTALPYAIAYSSNGRGVNYTSYGITKIDLSQSSISNDFREVGLNNTVLTSAILPAACTAVAYSAFEGCTALTSVTQGSNEPTDGIYLPNVTTLSGRAFLGCTKITSVYLPNVTKLSANNFSNCTALSEISLPACTQISTGEFSGCTSLVSAYLPLAESSSSVNNLFYGCTKLTSVTAPLISGLYQTFYQCKALVEIDLPSVTKIDYYSFYQCTNLQTATFGDVTTVGSYAFSGCTSLVSLDFTKCTAVPTLGNTNAFTSTNSTFEIKVPTSLYDEWIAATNWSTYAARIVAV